MHTTSDCRRLTYPRRVVGVRDEHLPTAICAVAVRQVSAHEAHFGLHLGFGHRRAAIVGGRVVDVQRRRCRAPLPLLLAAAGGHVRRRRCLAGVVRGPSDPAGVMRGAHGGGSVLLLDVDVGSQLDSVEVGITVRAKFDGRA